MKGCHGHKAGRKNKSHKKHGEKSKSCRKDKKHKGHGHHHGKPGDFTLSPESPGRSISARGRSRPVAEELVARVDMERCEACGKCLKFCRKGAITVDRDGASINAALCVGCGDCVDGCPVDAISLVGR